ncbi:MAG TPA: class I SAM-dependent methyltransferase [Candidatus Kapabacteria bacterium]|jgi:ubiquinone/menaquinone biosynthesis C-methylase UbiE|nr:class I SAM-dependent methyltransferase [Candidatus Kapabacteria bacterium]
MVRPSHLNRENADAFADEEVARSYRYRPAYPPDTIDFLAGLVKGTPRRVLDLGCGTGFIARPITAFVDHVDAVDASSAMLAEARRQPGGDDRRIHWIASRAEAMPVEGPYGLITAGESLHWMDWPVVLPRCVELLAPGGSLAIARIDTVPTRWEEELQEVIASHSVVKDYHRFDMIAALEQAKLFQRTGEFESQVVRREESVAEFIESFHARSSLTRSRLGPEAAASFDREIEYLVARYEGDSIVREIRATVVYGTPGRG